MEPAVLAQRFVDAFNARDEAALRALYHPDARIKRPTWPSVGDVRASLESIRRTLALTPTAASRRGGTVPRIGT
jgi:hypothetical protein